MFHDYGHLQQGGLLEAGRLPECAALPARWEVFLFHQQQKPDCGALRLDADQWRFQ